jgi:ABC-type branched-subunit amino acid transport system ATPase component/ABC-type branched-subunit amino acid transport system permease subunit
VSIEVDPPVTTGPGRHGSAQPDRVARVEFAPIDTSRNPYSKARPLTSLLRQPLNILFAILAFTWIWPVRDYWVFTISAGMVIAVVALGVMVMTGWCREVNLASAGVYATSLYLASYVYRDEPGWGKPLWLAVLTAIAIGAGIMLAVSLLSVRFSGVYVMVFTLGVQIMVERIMFTRYHLTGGDTALENPRPVFFGHHMEGHDRQFYLFLLVVLFLVMAFLYRLRHSPYGRGMMLAGADQQSAAAVGISPWRAKALGFGISGALSGLSGILAAMLFVSAPTTVNYQATTSLLWLSIAILGGFDSMTAVVGVALLFQGVPFLLEKLHVDYQGLAGVSLLAGVLCGARGVGGRLQDIYRRLRFGPAAKRRAARPTSLTTSASVLSRADGIADLAEYGGASPAVRKQALDTLEGWFPARRTEEIALSAQDVWQSFGGVKALQGAHIQVRTGSFTGLIGPNGAGKTTLFDVVSGLQRPDRGTVRIFNEDVTRMRPWHRAGLGMTRTFQTQRTIKELGVCDNLLAGAGLRIDGNMAQFVLGDPRVWRQMREAEEAAWAIAQLLNIDRYWDERVGELEFSARRRTELGRALMSGPQILLLDEPTSGLDPASSGALIGLVRQLQADLGLTVLLVEHYVKAVLEGCDTVYVLAEGRTLAHGEPLDVAGNVEVQTHYLGAGAGSSTTPWRERLAEERRTGASV